MTPTVPPVKVEIEFTDGVWTDVTTYVESDIQISRPRTSVFSPVGPASCSFTLNNPDGRFTPQRQVLTDGATAHPYYPNVQPRRRVRVSYLKTTDRVRFLGRIKEWPVALDDGVWNRATITATDEADRLSRVEMNPALDQEINEADPSAWWTLGDEAGATTAAERFGGTPLTVITQGGGADTTLTFGVDGPPGSTSTALLLAPTSASVGRYLQKSVDLTSRNGFELVLKVAAPPGSERCILSVTYDDGDHTALYITTSGFLKLVTFDGATTSTFTDTASVADGGWHHVGVHHIGFPFTTYDLWRDGTNVGGIVDGAFASVGSSTVNIGQNVIEATSALFGGTIAHVAFGMTSTGIAARASALLGFSGETTGERIERFLSYADVTSGLDVDTGEAVVGPYPQDGKSVLQACQDMTVTEGGASVVYIAPDGSPTFRDRDFRAQNTAAVMTLSARDDLDLDGWAPTFNEDALVNDVTGNRATYSGTQSTWRAVDQDSIDEYQRTSESFDSYATTDADVLANAQDRLSRQAWPAFRLPQVTLDAGTATTDFFALLPDVEIGSVITIDDVPAGALPGAEIDLIVEGWSETIGKGGTTYRVVFDTSPVGNIGPADSVSQRGIYDTARYQAEGMTLNSSLTSSATTVAIATSGGNPTFTTTGGDYPLDIQVGEEQIRLNSAPGGSSSPQTFTGCTRGVNGTIAAAQASGASVDLAPIDTYAL
jgi:hypothetical protein